MPRMSSSSATVTTSAVVGAPSESVPVSHIVFISADKHRFILERRAAMVSGLVRTMLSSDAFAESGGGKIEFPEISGRILELVIHYFFYKLKYNNSRVPIPEFRCPPEYALEVLAAANYMDC